MTSYANRVYVTSATTGTGTLTLGSAYSTAFCTMAQANAVTGNTYRYVIEDGNNFEIGYGVWTSSGNTLTRNVTLSMIFGSAGTSLLTCDGNQTVRIIVAAEDLEWLDFTEATIASATTTDLSTVNVSRVVISGTTTIASLGSGATLLRFVRFSGALTLTYNSTSLILPGAANIKTAAGDIAIFASDTSGNWRCLNYQAASSIAGVAIVGGTIDNAVIGGATPLALNGTVLSLARQTVANANATVSAGISIVAYTSISAARTVTLVAASTFKAGQQLLIVDESGSCSATDTITISRAGSDTINGATSAVMSSAYAYIVLESNGSSKWTIVDSSTLSMAQQAAASVAITGGTVDGTVIGGATPAAASVTAPSAGDSSSRAIPSAWYGQNLPGGNLNKFRNGTMDVCQQGTSGTSTTTAGPATQTATDGWYVVPTGASVNWAQIAGRLLTKYSLQVYGASSVTDLIIKQRIESMIAAPMASQTVTVQAQVYNGTGGSITPKLSVNRATGVDNGTYTNVDVNAVSLQACANAAWTQVAYTFAANASSGNGLEIVFDFGNNFSTTSKYVQITECDIRVTPGVSTWLNSNPPPPELRAVAVETDFCERYYELSGPITGYANGTSSIAAAWQYRTRKRANPTISVANGTSVIVCESFGYGNASLSSPSIQGNDLTGGCTIFSVTSSVSGYTNWVPAALLSGALSADARL